MCIVAPIIHISNDCHISQVVWGGAHIKGGACPYFLHFWPRKGVSFFQNANNLNIKLFLGCIYIVYIVFLDSFKSWISISEKKLYKLTELGGRGGGNSSNIRKNAFFPEKNVPKDKFILWSGWNWLCSPSNYTAAPFTAVAFFSGCQTTSSAGKMEAFHSNLPQMWEGDFFKCITEQDKASFYSGQSVFKCQN